MLLNCILVVLVGACLATTEDTLELVHVIFRHGDRNPDQISLWDSNPYYNESFYKGGFGQLTNEGKRTEYKLGSLLRQRYDAFLGDEYNYNYLDVRSTDYNRTKMSALLVLAGLWPPTGEDVWMPFLNWQPIPYNYVPTKDDTLLAGYSACSNVQQEIRTVIQEPDMAAYIEARYNETFDILETNTGFEMDMFQAFYVYFGILVQDQLGFELEDWTHEVYPEPLHAAAVDFYYLMTNTTSLRRNLAGYVLKKILMDSKGKIDGTISPSTRKMFIYSAHEMNVAQMILSLELYPLTDIPSYGAHVLFELHKIDGVYGLKLFYQNYEEVDPIPVKLPGCDYFCTFDDFVEQTADLMPVSDLDCNSLTRSFYRVYTDLM